MRAKRFPLVLLLLLPIVAGLGRPAFSAPATQPPLILATAALSPLSASSNDPGFVSSVAEEAFRRIGLTIQVDRMPAERALISANSGLVDGDLLRIAGMTALYPNLEQVPEPLFEFEFLGFSRADRDIEVRSWADLAPYAVGYVRGWKFYEQRLPQGSRATAVGGIGQLMELLRSDRVDVILLDRWQTLWAAREVGVAVRPVGPPFAVVPLYLYLNRRHAALVGPLSRALAEVKQDGTYAALWHRILSPLEAR